MVKVYQSQKNISIFPWTNETGNKSYDGFSMGIDDLVMKKLQDIQGQDETISPKIEAIRDSLSEKDQERQEVKGRSQMGTISRYQTGNIQGGQMGSLQTLGKISLGPVDLPVDLLLSYITRALGGKYIKGYLQKYGSVLKIAIHIETRPSLMNLFTIKRFRKKAAPKRIKRRHRIRYIELGWEESAFANSIESVIEDISYAIYYELSETKLPENWRVYRHFLKGKQLYHRYSKHLDHPELLLEAEKEMLGVVRGDSSFIDGQYLMGLIAIHFGRYESALLRFEQVINALRGNSETNAYYEEVLLSSYMNVATIYQKIYNDSTRASQLIDKALIHQKNCPLSVYLSKVDILLNTNQVDEAKQTLDACSKKPQNDQEKEWLNEVRARIHFQLREYEDALNFCNKILETDPENLIAHFYRAYIYTQSDDFQQADADYKAVLSYNSKREFLLYNYLWYALRSNGHLELQAAFNRYESIYIGFPYTYQPDFFGKFISGISVRESEKRALVKLAEIISNQKLTYEDVWKHLVNLYHSEGDPERELYLFYALGIFSFSKNLLEEFEEKLADIRVLFSPPDFSRYYLGFALHIIYLRWLMLKLRLDTTGKFSKLMKKMFSRLHRSKDFEPLDFIRIQLVHLLMHMLTVKRGFIAQFNLLDVYDLINDYYNFVPLTQDNVDALYEEKIEVLKRKIDILSELGLKRDASDIYVRIAEEYENWSRFKRSDIIYYNNLIGRAHEALDKAFALDETNYEILGRRSLLFYDQANDVEAIRAGEQSLERKYDQDWVHYNLGMSYKFIGNYAQAEARLCYAIEFKRKDWRPESFSWDPYLQLTKVYREQEKYDLAIETLKDAIRHYPQYDEYSLQLAEIYCLNQQYLQGLNELGKVNWSNSQIGDITLLLKLAEWGLKNNQKLEIVGRIAAHCEKLYLKNMLNDTFLLSLINLLIGWSFYFHSNLAEAIKKAEQAERFLPDHPYTLALKALVLEKYARFSQSKEEREEYTNWSLDYWRDLYLLTEDHVFKKRAENTLKYFHKID